MADIILHIKPLGDYYCLMFDGTIVSRPYETNVQASYAIDIVLNFLRTSGINEIHKFVKAIVEFTELVS